jgi:hypothetical protein
MAKQKKCNHIEILPVPRKAIAAVRGEEDFVELLRRELESPIPMNVERLADVAIPHDLQGDFGFKPEEDRIAVSRIFNLTEDQPWGVFLFEFKTKRPYLRHVRGQSVGLNNGVPTGGYSLLLDYTAKFSTIALGTAVNARAYRCYGRGAHQVRFVN